MAAETPRARQVRETLAGWEEDRGVQVLTDDQESCAQTYGHFLTGWLDHPGGTRRCVGCDALVTGRGSLPGKRDA